MSSISRRSYRGTGIPAWNWKSVIVNLKNGKGVSSTAKAVISSNADPLKLNKKNIPRSHLNNVYLQQNRTRNGRLLNNCIQSYTFPKSTWSVRQVLQRNRERKMLWALGANFTFSTTNTFKAYTYIIYLIYYFNIA